MSEPTTQPAQSAVPVAPSRKASQKAKPKQSFRGQVAKISQLIAESQKDIAPIGSQAKRALAAHGALERELLGLMRTLQASDSPDDREASNELRKLQLSIATNRRMLSAVVGASSDLHDLRKFKLEIE